MSQSQTYYTFEKFMLYARNFPELVVLEGYCSACNSYSPAVSNLLEYLEAYFEILSLKEVIVSVEEDVLTLK